MFPGGWTLLSRLDTRVIWRRVAECHAGQLELTGISLSEQTCHPHLPPLLGWELSWNSQGHWRGGEGDGGGQGGPPAPLLGVLILPSWSQSSLVCWQSFRGGGGGHLSCVVSGCRAGCPRGPPLCQPRSSAGWPSSSLLSAETGPGAERPGLR